MQIRIFWCHDEQMVVQSDCIAKLKYIKVLKEISWSAFQRNVHKEKENKVILMLLILMNYFIRLYIYILY